MGVRVEVDLQQDLNRAKTWISLYFTRKKLYHCPFRWIVVNGDNFYSFKRGLDNFTD